MVLAKRDLLKLPTWAYPLLGMGTGAAANIILYKTVAATLTGGHPIYQNPDYPYGLQYNDDNIIGQALGVATLLAGIAMRDVKIIGFGAGWSLEELIAKFIVEAKNAGFYGKDAGSPPQSEQLNRTQGRY